jgi:hypothetical protein
MVAFIVVVVVGVDISSFIGIEGNVMTTGI